MINENHIIQFEYSDGLYNGLCINNDIYINEYKLSKTRLYIIYIDIYYNNLSIHGSLFSDYDFDYIFNLSNMLYKLHTKDYYSKTYWNKELI